MSYSGWSLIKQASAIEWNAIVYLILNKVNSSLKEIQNVADPSYDFSYTQVHVRLFPFLYNSNM